MPSFQELLAQGASNAWLFVPTAIMLGALHGLEPGHSKTLMAAFIVAIRGTILQAFLLGLATTISHSAIVWGIALGGLYFWQGLDAETSEPYLQLVSGILIIVMALWMIRRTWQESQEAKRHEEAAAAHEAESKRRGLSQRIDTGHGLMALEIPEGAGPVRWRVKVLSGDEWQGEYVSLALERPDGKRESFTFVDRDGFMESAEPLHAPYDFKVKLNLDHGDHNHDYETAFGTSEAGLVDTGEYMDAHARAHAEDIKKRFANRKVTTWQIIGFGLTGGLIPCPAAVTVLLLCLQLKELVLGTALVLCFSIGLGITLVGVGVIAAIGVNHASQRSSWFSTLTTRAPYLSGVIIIFAGLYVGWHGWTGIMAL